MKIVDYEYGKKLLRDLGINGYFLAVKYFESSEKFYIFTDKLQHNDLRIVLVDENKDVIGDKLIIYSLKDYSHKPQSRNSKGDTYIEFTKSDLEIVYRDVDGELDVDWPISSLTILDFAAILWKKPVSKKKELNILIEHVT